MVDLVSQLDMQTVRGHYEQRESAHKRLRQLFDAGNVDDFVQLALGISEAAGNYSASEHRQGPKILSRSSASTVFELATEIDDCPSANHLPEVIYRHDLPNLKISVGSEIAMMLRPNQFWVGNRRTIWSHLLVKHGKKSLANQELKLYFEGAKESEMTYEVWRDLYLALEQNLVKLGQLASDAAAAQSVTPGQLRFMWPDATATALFDKFAARK